MKEMAKAARDFSKGQGAKPNGARGDEHDEGEEGEDQKGEG